MHVYILQIKIHVFFPIVLTNIYQYKSLAKMEDFKKIYWEHQLHHMPMTNLTTDNITYMSAHRQDVVIMDVHSRVSMSPVASMSA